MLLADPFVRSSRFQIFLRSRRCAWKFSTEIQLDAFDASLGKSTTKWTQTTTNHS